MCSCRQTCTQSDVPQLAVMSQSDWPINGKDNASRVNVSRSWSRTERVVLFDVNNIVVKTKRKWFSEAQPSGSAINFDHCDDEYRCR